MRWERRPAGEARPEELLKRFPARIQQLVERARSVVLAAVPGAIEHVRPNRGYFGYRLHYQFVTVEPFQDHVRLGFPHGALLEDTAGLLRVQGATSTRYVSLERPSDTRRAGLAALLQAAAAWVPPRRPARGRTEVSRAQRRRHRTPSRRPRMP